MNHFNETPDERAQRLQWLQMGIQNDLYHPTADEITARLTPLQVETLTRFRETNFVPGMSAEAAQQELAFLYVWAVTRSHAQNTEKEYLRRWLALAWFLAAIGWFFAYGFWPRGGQ